MKKFVEVTDAVICFDEFSGECYLNSELVVIIKRPDSTEVLVENEDGDEIPTHWKELSVSDKLYSMFDEYKVK